MNRSKIWLKHLSPPILLGALLIFIFMKGVTTAFVYHDDFLTWPYTYTGQGLCIGHPLFNHLKHDKARPIASFVVCELANQLKTIEDSKWLRTIGLVGLWLFACGFFVFIRRYLKNTVLSLLTSGIVFSSIWTGILFGYIYNLTLLLAAFTSFVAGVFLVLGMEAGRGRLLRIVFSILGCALGLAAYLTYQTAATWCCIAPLLVFLFSEGGIQKRVELIWKPVVAIGAIMLAYFAVIKFVLLDVKREGHDILYINDNLLDRIFWFFSSVVPDQAFHVVDYTSQLTILSPWFFIPIVFVAPFVYFSPSGLRKSLGHGILFIFVCAGFLLLSYIPGVASAAGKSTTMLRSSSAMVSSGLIMFSWSLYVMLNKFIKNRSAMIGFCSVLLLGLLAIVSITSKRAFLDGIVAPITQEQNFLSSKLKQYLDAGQQPIYIVFPDLSVERASYKVVYDELFTSMSYFPNDFIGATISAMDRVGYKFKSVEDHGLKYKVNGYSFVKVPYHQWKMENHTGDASVNFVDNFNDRDLQF